MLKCFDSGTSEKRQRNGRMFNLKEERQRGHITVYRYMKGVMKRMGLFFSLVKEGSTRNNGFNTCGGSSG